MTLAPTSSAQSVLRDRYRLELLADGMSATLASLEGEPWLQLRLVSAFDTTAGRDETLAVGDARALGASAFEIERRSTVWERAGLVVTCTDDAVELRSWVEGAAPHALTTVTLLGGRALMPGRPAGFLPSGSSFRTLFTPNPDDPARLLRSARESAVIGAVGDGEPGRGHWFFTPAPLLFALTTREVDLVDAAGGGWFGISVAAPVAELGFVELAYVGADRGLSLRFDYEGHTRVDGRFEGPTIVLMPSLDDPYAALRAQRVDLARRGYAPPAVRAPSEPGWWRRPIFCGWGAQSHLASVGGGLTRDYATQTAYDGFLADLERNGVIPGTVVIDDKWQEAYATCKVDEAKWPDLRGWIGDRHARGQRVLLWWKAWDPEGAPDALCVRSPDGAPIALDPTNPDACLMLRESVSRMLDPSGYDADGLKIDFTGRTPSGAALVTHEPVWGIALLHRLLETVYEAAKQARPDALIVTHTPHPSFADVTDMIRLNDMLRLDDEGPPPDVIAQMRHRAHVVNAACPELPIDTDDWCAPDLATWRAYLELKPELGVPALYYATHIDATGERLGASDYASLRRTWAR